jgi:hypothetical protein
MQIEIKTNLEPHIVSTSQKEIKRIAIYDEGVVVGTLELDWRGNSINLESYFHGYELKLCMRNNVPVIVFEKK